MGLKTSMMLQSAEVTTEDVGRLISLPWVNLEKLILGERVDWLHKVAILVFGFLFLLIFYWQLDSIQVTTYRSPFSRVISGAATTMVAPFSPELAIRIQISLKPAESLLNY